MSATDQEDVPEDVVSVRVAAGEGGEDAGAEVGGEDEVEGGEGPDLGPGEDWPVGREERHDPGPASLRQAEPRHQGHHQQDRGRHAQLAHMTDGPEPAQAEEEEEDDDDGQGDELSGLQGKHLLHAGSLPGQVGHLLKPRAGGLEGGEDLIESSGDPDQEGDVEEGSEDDRDVDGDTESWEERAEVVVEIGAGEGGVLAEEHLHQEERDPHRQEQEAVEEEEGGPAVSDDGEREEEERVVGETESRAGCQETSLGWPWGLVNRGTGHQLLTWPT